MNRLLINEFNINQNLDDFDSIVLIIQNKKKLLKILNDVCDDCLNMQFIKIIDEKGRLLKLSDYLDVIVSLFNIDINNKKNLNALYRQIKKTNIEDFYESINTITNNLQKLFGSINLESSLNLISDIDINEEDILKLLKIQINDNDENMVNRIMNYLKVGIELRNIKKYLIFNLSSLLSFEEINLLLHDCKIMGIQIINIEYEDLPKLDFGIKKILDDDICLIE